MGVGNNSGSRVVSVTSQEVNSGRSGQFAGSHSPGYNSLAAVAGDNGRGAIIVGGDSGNDSITRVGSNSGSRVVSVTSQEVNNGRSGQLMQASHRSMTSY